MRQFDFLLIFVCFYCLIGKVEGAVAGSANQNVTIKRLTTFVSGFLTYNQYCNLSNTLMNDLFAGKTIDEIKAGAQSTVMGVLTSAQYSTALGKATGLIFTLGPSGIQAAITNLTGVMANNLQAFFNQVVVYYGKLKTQGMQQKGIQKNIYRIVNSFASKKRIKTIFTRVSLKFTASQWKSLSSSLEGLINFKKNGF